VKFEEYQSENEKLKLKIEFLDKELTDLKRELMKQLNTRESELIDYEKQLTKYKELEKRYHALRNSTLGKLTNKYWRIRKKLKKGNPSK
jgi:predicted nuclease with TOPRIM domain